MTPTLMAVFPKHVRGEAIPLPMRVVHLSHDMEAIGRIFSSDRALEAARDRRDRTYDPAPADVFQQQGRGWLERLRTTEPWDAVLALEPEPHRLLQGGGIDDALTIVADFIDLKSPYMGGHSRRCAELAANAGRVLGFDENAVTTLRRAALVHDFGITGVPTRSGTNRVRLPGRSSTEWRSTRC
jgi:HD-GYP domain-containing protein (c-di-GMP phosphodiesterase class II)